MHIPRCIPMIAGAILAVGLVISGIVIEAGQQAKKVRVIYTTDTLGWLEPCGCSKYPQGGLARRVTAISKLRSENPNTLVVESGNLTNMRERFGIVADTLAALRYDAIGVGDTDLRVCGQRLYEEAAQRSLTVLDAAPDAPATASPFMVKLVDGVRVGVFSFNARANKTQSDSDYELRKALYRSYRAVRLACDVLVVLDEGGVIDKEWLDRNGARFGVPDVVIGGTARCALTKEEVVGVTHIVPSSLQGKAVGVVDIEVNPGEAPRLDVRSIPINGETAEDEATAKRVKGLLSDRGKTLQPVQANSDKAYYSVASCTACHPNEYANWRTTKHARAMQTLVDRQRLLPDCLPCHSEQFRRLQTANAPADGVGGVECASCHASVLPHGMERQGVAAKSKVDPRTCQVCHTKDRSPEYDEKSYFAKVVHTSPPQSTAMTVR